MNVDSEEWQDLYYGAKQYRQMVAATRACKEFAYEAAHKAITAEVVTVEQAATYMNITREHMSRLHSKWKVRQSDIQLANDGSERLQVLADGDGAAAPQRPREARGDAGGD